MEIAIIIAVILALAVLFFVFSDNKNKANYANQPKHKKEQPAQPQSAEFIADTQHHNNMLQIEELADTIQANPLLNKTERDVFFVLNSLLRNKKLYCHQQVSLAAFIKFAQPLARHIISRRVDFLLVDSFSNPKAVIEVNGTGHYSTTSRAYKSMDIKKLVCRLANIELLEIHVSETPDKDRVRKQLASFIEGLN